MIPATRDLLADAMSEADLQTQVVGMAEVYGWKWYHTHDSRRSPGGFPDLVLVHPRARRLIFAELKKQRGKFRPGQREWLAALAMVAEVHLWRPADLLDGHIQSVLTERR